MDSEGFLWVKVEGFSASIMLPYLSISNPRDIPLSLLGASGGF